MKILLLNGSPRPNGNTAAALDEMEAVFAAEGLETERVQVGNRVIRGCIACGKWAGLGRCVFDDLVNELAPKLEAGVFQPELYYLLTPLRLSLPPLRTRPDDLNQAIDMCLDDCVVKFNRYVVLTREARRLLMDYPWPGNYIQLRAFLERMVLTAPARTVNDGYVRSLLEELYPLPVVRAQGQALPTAVSPEAARLAEVLSRNGGSRAAAAAELGISKTTLWRRMKQYGIRDRFEG